MGGNKGSKISNESELSVSNYKFYKIEKDPRYGEIKLLKEISSGQLVISKEKTYNKA